MAHGYVGAELHPEKINDMDCSSEVMQLLSRELRDLRERIARIERVLSIKD